MAKQTALVYEDLATFPDDNLRREIIGGDLYVTPSPERPHQKAAGEIFAALRLYAKATNADVYFAPLDTIFSAQNVVQPDLVYVSAERVDVLGHKAIYGVPSLVVEILSPSTSRTDRVKKRELYARFGVPEYWIVDTDAKTIERCSDPRDGAYASIVLFERDFAAATLPGFTLDPNEVFA